MLLGLDGLGLLEDVHAAGEALESLAHLLGLDDLGLLEDVHAAGEALKGLAHLLGLEGRKHRAQLCGSALLSGRSDDELACALVVTGAVAVGANHVVRLCEEEVVRFAVNLCAVWLLFNEKT